MANNWTETQLLIALGLYCELPFGQFHKGNKRIIKVAEKIGRSPSALSMKLCNLASLDPVITGSGRSGLVGASSADRVIWKEFSERPDLFMPRIEEEMSRLEEGDEAGVREQRAEVQAPDYAASDKYGRTKQRQGQNVFRDAVLSSYEFKCCVTGVVDQRLLVASHIRPWSEDELNRLNPRNGLCLSTLYDRAFDIGLITFSEDHELMVSSELERQSDNPYIEESFTRRKGTRMLLPNKFSPDEGFLAWHREKHFRS